jgi:hypothetical protein
MNLRELKSLLENSTEENIEFDEPHVSLRCEENNIKKESIIHTLLRETNKLTHFIEDRPKVYKLYFKLSERRQLKVIIDIVKPRRIMIRTVKVLDRKLYKNTRIINLKKKRF